jgi:nucleotide-binding universal stress UspA family protein
VTAQHVVDLKNAWDFVGHDQAGLLSRDEYVEVFEGLSESLFKLGERLGAAYGKAAESAGIKSDYQLDSGNPYVRICEKALDNDMVVIGHRTYAASDSSRTSRQFLRFSIAESLAHGCPKPLLVVQNETPTWLSMTILVSSEHVNRKYIDECLDLAEFLKLQPALVCHLNGVNEEPPVEFIEDLRKSDRRLSDIPIATTGSAGPLDATNYSNWGPDERTARKTQETNAQWDEWSRTLLVIPTREVGGRRLTIAGGSPAMFVRYLTLPAVLLWPEDSAHLIRNPNAEDSAMVVRT